MATLFSDPDSFRAKKVLAAAAYGSTKVSVKNADPPAKDFPSGVLPALQSGKKAVVGDAGILWEVAAASLKGQSKEHESAVVGWLAAAESDYAPAILGWVLPCVGVMKADKKAVDGAKAHALSLLNTLDGFLLSRTFLVGERLSLADISLAFNLQPAFQHVLDGSARSAHQNLTRWYTTVMGQEKVKAVAGDLALASTTAVFDPKKAAAAGQADKGKKAEKKDKKKEEPKAKPAPEPMDDEPAAPVKKADPFDAFPKPSFNMDEFKRVYSNEDTEKKAIPYLLDNIDWENHSVWFCEYKYPEDLGQVFMSCNLIGGMFQRLDKLRKHAFASVALFGESNASTISGVWIWRGPELAFTLSPDWQIDFESYQWTKMDPKDSKTIDTIKEYLLWEGKFGGKSFNQGKIFK